MMIVGLFNDATNYYGHTASERLYKQECVEKQDNELKFWINLLDIVVSEQHTDAIKYAQTANWKKQNASLKV